MGSRILTRLTDNMRYGQGKPLSDIVPTSLAGDEREKEIEALRKLLDPYAGRSLSELKKDCPGLIIFPQDASTYVDDVEESMLFDLRYGREKQCTVIETGNLMGAFGIGDVHISIGSRFDGEESKDKPYFRPVRHPYFSEYTMLQKISLQILRHEKMSHGDGSDKLSGIVFDGAWLWEEYLNKVMQERLKEGALRHPQNKRHLEPLHIYKPKSEGGKSRKPIYPDFLWCSDSSRDKGQSWDVVLDAKYKRAFQEENGKSHFAVAREDRYQMISYLHLTKAKLGVFICPLSPDEKKQVSTGSSEEEDFEHVDDNYYREGSLLGHGGEIAVVPFSVPSSKNCDFCAYGDQMKAEEKHFCDTLKSVMKDRKEQETVRGE